ncbi:MAG: hypothetical protein KGH64_05990 [Candidatus Micrarchaeota archaeon]|nr:hypothetical protein [Candidatus Micrarchaeota archaeon]
MKRFVKTVSTYYEQCNSECDHCGKSLDNSEDVTNANGVAWCVKCVDSDNKILSSIKLDCYSETGGRFPYDPNNRTFKTIDGSVKTRTYFYWVDQANVKKIKELPKKQIITMLKPHYLRNRMSVIMDAKMEQASAKALISMINERKEKLASKLTG